MERDLFFPSPLKQQLHSLAHTYKAGFLVSNKITSKKRFYSHSLVFNGRSSDKSTRISLLGKLEKNRNKRARNSLLSALWLLGSCSSSHKVFANVFFSHPNRRNEFGVHSEAIRLIFAGIVLSKRSCRRRNRWKRSQVLLWMTTHWTKRKGQDYHSWEREERKELEVKDPGVQVSVEEACGRGRGREK